MWLNCRNMQGCATELTRYLREHTGLYLSEGRQYGENGTSFIRMNIACPRSRLEDGLKRLAEGISDYGKWVPADCWYAWHSADFRSFAKYLHSGRKRNGMIYQDWLTHFPQRFCMLRCFFQGIIVLMPFDHGRGPASGRADPSVIPVTDEIYSGESFKFIGVFFSVITLI